MNSRRCGLLAVFVPLLLAVQLVFWPDTSSSYGILHRFPPEHILRSTAYGDFRYWWFGVAAGGRLALLLLLALPTVSRALYGLARDLTGGPLAAGAVMALVCCAASKSLGLALDFRSHYLLDRQYGLTRQGVGGWLGDNLLEHALDSALTVAAVGLVLAVAQRFERQWWVASAVLLSAATVALVALQPVLIDPLFDAYRPLAARPGAARLIQLAEAAGFDKNRLWIADVRHRTNKSNAFFNGLGPTERIAVWDTLLDSSAPEEAELVLAHELGHWKGRHTAAGTLLAVVGIAAGMLFLGLLFQQPAPQDVPALLFTVSILLMASLPFQNHLSRRIEAEADWTALELTGRHEAYVRAEEQLARQNLAHLHPAPLAVWMLYTHPTVADRIEMGLSYGRAVAGKTRRK